MTIKRLYFYVKNGGLIMNITKIPCNISNYGGYRGLEGIKYIVIHYTANNGDTATGNGNYFKNNYVGASAHYFVDETNIIQSVEDNREAWHCGASIYYHKECRNKNALGIEICSEKDNKGKYFFNVATIENAIKLTTYLKDKYNIADNNIIRHYDVTHKNCPAPFVENPAEWEKFKARLNNTTDNKEGAEMVETGYITIDGKTIKINKILKDGTNYIALRGFEHAGYTVGYDANTKIPSLVKDVSKLPIMINGEDTEISAINIEGTNYVAVRDLASKTGAFDVDYIDGEIHINSN